MADPFLSPPGSPQSQRAQTVAVVKPYSVEELAILPAEIRAKMPQPPPCDDQLNEALRVLKSVQELGPQIFRKPLPKQKKTIQIGAHGSYFYTTRNGTFQYLTRSQTRRCHDKGYLDGPKGEPIRCPSYDKLIWSEGRHTYVIPEQYRPAKREGSAGDKMQM